jgi:hydrogenase maturation factor
MSADGIFPADALASAAFSLARRFADGGTLWCVAPEWPAHARHVAVEFVHPVIVGKRALPAIHLAEADAAESLRLLARPGDIVLVISSSVDACAADLLARAEAWGLTRIRIGAGRPPHSRTAEHTVWLEETEAAWATRSGDLVLLYHLLWELTHVVFEHPGLMRRQACDEETCITCSDEGRVAEVQVIRPDAVEVLVDGRPETVDASLVEPLALGDLVLVHAGVVLTTLSTPPHEGSGQ